MSTVLPYRPNVCMLVMNSDRKLFLGQRYNEASVWQFPQGGVEEGLSLEANVLKELEEELGPPKSLFTIVQKLKATHTYDFTVIPEYAKGVWRGQTQTFWLVRYLGTDADLNFNRHTPEFSAFKWCSADEVRGLAEPKRVIGYESALREYESYLRQ